MLDQVGDAGVLRRIDDRAHIDALVQRVADAQARHPGLEFVDDLPGDAFLDQKSGTGATNLALIEPNGVDHAFDGAIDVGIVEQDESRLAAQFEGQFLTAAGGLATDLATDLGRPGEGDLVDAGMADDCGTGVAAAGDDVDKAGRQAGFLRDFGKAERGQTGIFRRLEHHRVAGRQGWCDLPGQHQQRKIPWDDLAGDANRQMVGKLAAQQLGPAGMVVEMAGDQRDVDIAGFADRFAVVHRLQNGQHAGVLLHQAGQRVERPGAVMVAGFGPLLLRLPGRGDRAIDVFGRTGGNLRQHRAGGRIAAVEPFARRRLLPAAVDKMTELAVVAIQPTIDLGAAFRRRAVIHALQDLGDGHGLYPAGCRCAAA